MKAALIYALMAGCGGFVGALARYGLSGWVHRQMPLATFPYGTLAVNLLGCLLVGLVAGLVESRQLFSPEIRIFALIGVLGGFTTFSTFGFETFVMLRGGEYMRAGFSVAAQLLLGLALVWMGYAVTTSR